MSGQLFFPAQTNTALYCQLHERGHPQADLLLAQQAYRLSCKLFNGRYRKTERSFICHSVGAASAVAQFDRRIEWIVAGMLHAAYDSGLYPDGRGGPTSAHRRWLSDQVGTAIEGLVADYTHFRFGVGEPERLAEEGLADGQADLLLIALAHEVDDLADGGLAFAPKYGRSLQSRVTACASLARRYGWEALAATLEGHGRRYEDVRWIAALESPVLEGFRIAPNMLSYLRLRNEHRRGKSVEVF